MSERGILFSAPMVRALLSGSKTQTRRAFKDSPPQGVNVAIVNNITLRFGGPGDRLWVREAWRAELTDDARPPRDLDRGSRVWFIADGSAEDGGDVDVDAKPGKPRPGMFMPRWASRITLEVTEVRIERLQDISGNDATAEGAPLLECYGPDCPDGPDGCNQRGCLGAREWYQRLWDQINGAGSWDANPWVWVVAFRRIDAR